MSGDVFPPMNLPDDGKGQSAVPWGRSVQSRIVTNEGAIQSLSQALGGQNRNSASSIQTLGNQVRDLVGRTSYSLSGNSFQTWTTTQPDDYPFGSVLTFTLNEARIVSIEFLVDVTAGVNINNTSSSAGARVYTSVFVDSVPYFPTTFNQVSADVNGGTGRATSQGATSSGTPSARVLIPLSAGTHTVQGSLRQRRVTVSGSGNGSISVDGYQIFVDVLQPVT